MRQRNEAGALERPAVEVDDVTAVCGVAGAGVCCGAFVQLLVFVFVLHGSHFSFAYCVVAVLVRVVKGVETQKWGRLRAQLPHIFSL